jgi:molybdopterin synthase catalytic subunit
VADIIRVQTEDFDLSTEMRHLSAGRTDIGGTASFVGLVRGTAKGRALTSMTLEHYPGMTEKALHAIAADATARFALQATTLIHRVGPLLPGAQIVLVLTAAPHRHAALDGCAFLIDWLKTKAPFWKCEYFTDGTSAWVDAREDDCAAAAKWGALG